ncbi:MAG: ribonuclease P protein component 4 [Candidatus Woesearchaeota archaeon]
MDNKSKAIEHINELFAQAEEMFLVDKELSRRYIFIARKTAMKYKVRIDKSKRFSFCKKCNSFLKKGVNSSVRVRKGRIILTCNECGFARRFVYR